VGLAGSQRRIVSRQHLAGESDDAIAVMVVQEIPECSLPHQKCCVPSCDLANSLRERAHDLRQASEAWIF
jgi:hypothetical protein